MRRHLPATGRHRAFRPLVLLLGMGCGALSSWGLAGAPAAAQPPPAPASWRAFTGFGEAVSLYHPFPAMGEADVVFLGEHHDDPVAHQLQERILRELHRAVGGERPVILSLEMFEGDVQDVLDEYLAGLITEEHFLRAARPWPNYPGDYRPLVEYAREHGIPVVAANPPRRYVNRVAREGPESLADLPPSALRFLPPLPLHPPSEAYIREWNALMSRPAEGPAGGTAGTDGHPREPAPAHPPEPRDDADVPRTLWAQTLWDAGMAHAIAGALERHPGALVIHLAGSFHVENGTGIPEHLQRYRPGTRSVTVVFRPVDDVERFDPGSHAGAGDLVVLTDRSLPRTR